RLPDSSSRRGTRSVVSWLNLSGSPALRQAQASRAKSRDEGLRYRYHVDRRYFFTVVVIRGMPASLIALLSCARSTSTTRFSLALAARATPVSSSSLSRSCLRGAAV